MYTEVGRQAARFSARHDRTTVLLTWLDSDASSVADPHSQRAYLRRRFAGAGWEVPQMLDSLDKVRDLYFDRLSQVRMDPPARWYNRRIALVGDAAFCPSPLAGEGSSMAMTSSYILADPHPWVNVDLRRLPVFLNAYFLRAGGSGAETKAGTLTPEVGTEFTIDLWTTRQQQARSSLPQPVLPSVSAAQHSQRWFPHAAQVQRSAPSSWRCWVRAARLRLRGCVRSRLRC